MFNSLDAWLAVTTVAGQPVSAPTSIARIIKREATTAHLQAAQQYS